MTRIINSVSSGTNGAGVEQCPVERARRARQQATQAAQRAGRRLADSVGPPGFTPAAAKSTARRYPRHVWSALSLSGKGEQRALDPAARELLHASELGAVWLGHATVLLRLGERWVLTDPVFSHSIGLRVGPFTLGMSRHTPGVDPRTLPKADLVLLSHAHFDHLDRPSLRAIVDKATRVVTARGTSKLVPRGFGLVREIDWGEEFDVDGLSIGAVRPKHWGARTLWDKHRGYNSYLVRASTSRVLFAGDTAHCDAYENVGPVDLSIFGIGAYDPWIHAHASPEQVWAMHSAARGEFLLPVHHSTFELSDEPMDEPMSRLIAAAGEDEHRVVGRGLGEAWGLSNSAGA
jgi:L-ascorbate metabolism protein UlaG (beta-lactamase superfamily)